MIQDLTINIVAGALLLAVGWIARLGYTKWTLRHERSIWKGFVGRSRLGVALTTRSGPYPRSTPRVSLTEARAFGQLAPRWREVGIDYTLIDSRDVNGQYVGSRNMLVLGGPLHNELTKTVLQLMSERLPFTCELDPLSIRLAQGSYYPSYDPESGHVTEDYAIILRAPNPLDSSGIHTMMLVFGCHGFGTEGGVKLLTVSRLTRGLVAKVGNKSFVALVRVRIVAGQYIPKLQQVLLLT